MLTLAEELLLLALNDEKGSVVSSSAMALPFGLAGAVAMGLMDRDRVRLEDKILRVADASPTGDSILDTALQNLSESAKERKLQYWIARPDKLVPGLKNRLLERLVDNGILRKEERKFLWVFPANRYPEQEGKPERDIRRRLEDVIIVEKTADERTALLLCLVHVCGLAKEAFPGHAVKPIKAKLKNFAEHDKVAKAVAEQVQAVMMMIMVSTASMAAISASH